MTVKEVTDAIDELFGDTSVSQAQTLDWMKEIKDHIDVSIQALKESMDGPRPGESGEDMEEEEG